MTRFSRFVYAASPTLLEKYFRIGISITITKPGKGVAHSPLWVRVGSGIRRHTCSEIGTPGRGENDGLQEPKEPHPDECCGKGCAECVWTVYWEEMTNYRRQKAAQEGVVYQDPFQLLEQRLAKDKGKDKGRQES